MKSVPIRSVTSWLFVTMPAWSTVKSLTSAMRTVPPEVFNRSDVRMSLPGWSSVNVPAPKRPSVGVPSELTALLFHPGGRGPKNHVGGRVDRAADIDAFER